MTRLKRKKSVTNATERTTSHDVRFGTPELVAQYRAGRIAPGHDTIIEIGAGAGFQTAAFAKLAKKVIAVDIDAERLARGSFPENVVAIPGDALDASVIARIKGEIVGSAAVFLDPERPAQSKHRTLAEIQPDIHEFLDAYGAITKDIAIELPPFLERKEIPRGAEIEYLSVDGQLNRLTCYFGALRRDDVSVVQAPGNERIAHTGRLPGMREDLDIREARFVLEPDAALGHAGLVVLALPAHYRKLPLGKKLNFLASKKPYGPWFRSYRIVARGDEGMIRRAMTRHPPQAVILHGALDPAQQRELLASYKPLCYGKERVHLFIGHERILAVRERQ